MSIISDLIDGLGQSVSGVTSTTSDLWHGMSDFISSDQQHELRDRYSAFQSVLSVLWLYIQSLQAIQQEFAGLGNQNQPNGVVTIGQKLSDLNTEVTEKVIAPNTLSNVSKIFPGGLTFYLRGKELVEQNQILDTAFQVLTEIHAQVASLLSYYDRAYEALFDNLLQSQTGAEAQDLGFLRTKFLSILQSYASVNPASDADISGIESEFDQLNSQWRAASVAFALQMLQINATTVVANNKAASADRLRQMGVNPNLVGQVMGF